MAAVPSTSQHPLEYAIDLLHIKDSVDVLIARKDEISIRFSVNIRLEKPDGPDNDGCWVNIGGDASKVLQAKTYIKCLCAPDDKGSVHYPGDLHGHLSDKQTVFDLERKYKVIVEFYDGDSEDDPGEAIVSGESLNVALALSAIEDMVAQFYEGNETMSRGDSYSNATSNKLSHSLLEISGQIQLEKDEVVKYPDVMKKLILSWVNDAPEGQETVDLRSDDEDSGDDLQESTAQTSPRRTAGTSSSPVTSTPVVPVDRGSSRVKVERLTQLPGPSGLNSRPSPPATRDRMYVDLTESTTSHSSSDQTITNVTLDSDGSTSDDQASIVTLPTPTPRMLRQPASSETNPKSLDSSATMEMRRDSPTTQTERNISTITLNDDDSLSDKTLQMQSSTTESDEKTQRLAAIGQSRGYDEVEVAQALSLCDANIGEQKFFSLLNQVRKSETRSPTTGQDEGGKPGYQSPLKITAKTKKGRNAALESINKRQQSVSPGGKAAMPLGKRVKTVTGTNEAMHAAAVNSGSKANVRVIPLDLPVQDALNREKEEQLRQQQNLQKTREQQQQRYMLSREKESQQPPLPTYAPPPRPKSPPSQPTGFQPQRVSNYQQSQVPYYQQTQVPNHQQAQVPNYQQAQVPNYQQAQVPNYQQAQTSNYQQLQPANYQQPQILNYGQPQTTGDQGGLSDLLQPAPELPMRAGPKTRMVVLDGSNIAYAHGKKFYAGGEKIFSSEGILLAVNYLRQTYKASSENVKVIVPNFRRRDRLTRDRHLLDQMEASGYLVFSPCKTMPSGKKIVPYDDRFILDLAIATDGVVISNDKYADLITEQNNKYRDVINHRVIMFMFASDVFMIPPDPMGRYGPTLDELLRHTRADTSAVTKRYAAQPSNPVAAPSGRGYATQPAPQRHQDNTLYTGANRYTTLGILPSNRDYTDLEETTPVRLRLPHETANLRRNLLEIFPEKEDQIDGFLKRHPYETNMELFVDRLVS